MEYNRPNPIVALIFVSLLVAAGGALYYVLTPAQVSYESNEPANITDVTVVQKPIDEVPILKDESRKEDNVKEKYHINVVYPSLVLATAPQVATQASDVIKGYANRKVEDFLSEMRETLKGTSVPDEFESDFTMRYQPVLRSSSLLAIRFEASSYIRGAAHPMSETSVLLYDMTNHASLATADLFTPGVDYLDLLSQASREELRKQFTDIKDMEFNDQVIPGTAPQVENFRVVYPQYDGIHIVFNPYQVAAYARGTIEVFLPYSTIKNSLATSTRMAIENAATSSEAVIPSASTSSPSQDM